MEVTNEMWEAMQKTYDSLEGHIKENLFEFACSAAIASGVPKEEIDKIREGTDDKRVTEKVTKKDIQ